MRKSLLKICRKNERKFYKKKLSRKALLSFIFKILGGLKINFGPNIVVDIQLYILANFPGILNIKYTYFKPEYLFN